MNFQDYKIGFKKGIPIGLGYIPVAFSFGLFAVNGGIPVLAAVLISLTNLTSAGQFAGVQLLIAGTTYFEIALTTFIINIRYMLMSLAVSQKLKPGIKLSQRLIFSFGITDEVFAIASTEKGLISASYMYGLITTPIIGWTLGTWLGAVMSNILPTAISSAMGIALFAMFIAIIIPPAKKSKSIVLAIIAATSISCLIKYLPFLQMSSGFRYIIATVLTSAVLAYFFPVHEEVGR